MAAELRPEAPGSRLQCERKDTGPALGKILSAVRGGIRRHLCQGPEKTHHFGGQFSQCPEHGLGKQVWATGIAKRKFPLPAALDCMGTRGSQFNCREYRGGGPRRVPVGGPVCLEGQGLGSLSPQKEYLSWLPLGYCGERGPSFPASVDSGAGCLSPMQGPYTVS